MSNEYGRIHTDGSRSGGQPVLLPCPFCGGRAEIAEIETEDLPLWLGECQEPPCEAVAPVRPTRDEAIAAWNTRQPIQRDDYTRGFIAGLDDGAKMDAEEYAFRASQPTQSDALQAENERLREHLISALDTLKDAEVCDDTCGPCNEARAALE